MGSFDFFKTSKKLVQLKKTCMEMERWFQLIKSCILRNRPETTCKPGKEVTNITNEAFV